MFSGRKQLRRLAVFALLAWVFALVSGTVNACLIAPEAVTGTVAASHGSGARHHQPATPHDYKTACAKLCAAESTASPVAKKSEPPGPIWAVLPLSRLIVVQPLVDRVDDFLVAHTPRFTQTPIPIAFLRLAL